MKPIRALYSIIFITIVLFLLTGCENPIEPKIEPKEAKFEITATSEGMTSYGCPYILITVQNTGNATGYNVACYAYAKNSSGIIIIDTGFAYFAYGGNIAPGESTQADAIFFNLSSHSDYASVKYELSWLTRD